MTGRWLGFIRCTVGAVGFGRNVAVRRGLRRCCGGAAGSEGWQVPVFVDGGLHVWGWWMLGLEKEAWILWFHVLWPSRPCFLFRRPRATLDLLFLLCVACSGLAPIVGDDEPSPARHRRDRPLLGPQAFQHNGWGLWYKAVPCAVPFCRRYRAPSLARQTGGQPGQVRSNSQNEVRFDRGFHLRTCCSDERRP